MGMNHVFLDSTGSSRRWTRGVLWAGVTLGLVALSSLVLWGLPTVLTLHPALPDAAARHKAEADARNGVIAFLAFIGAGIGVFYNRKSVRQTRIEQITDRYSKAVDQLGSTTPEICVGGIYALQRIMRDSPDDKEAIVDVLSVFVRSIAKRTEDGSLPWNADEADRDEFKPSFRVQAAVKVLARRGLRGSPAAPDLRDSDLRGARLSDAHLSNASFRRSYLMKAHLDRADLREARFYKADLREARMEGADLSGAHLRHALLAGARLKGANLDGAVFTIGALTDEQMNSALNKDTIVWTSEEDPEVPEGPVS